MPGPEAIPTVTREEALEARAKQVDHQISTWIARQIAAWGAEFAEHHPAGGTLLVNDVAQPILNGSVAALARFAWDAAVDDATPNGIAENFKQAMLVYLRSIDRPPGALGKMEPTTH